MPEASEKMKHKVDPTPGAVSTVPTPVLRNAQGALNELINNEDLEESKFPGGRVYWPEEDIDAIRIDLDWDRENNEPL